MRKIVFLTLMLVISAYAWSQRTVTGKVTDVNGSPVAGASVQVLGAQVGTVTREDGSFSLTVPASGRAIVISAVGLATQQINIGSQTDIGVTLQPGVEQSLQEVVVVGYGTQRRREVTGSVSRVQGGAVAQRPTQSFEQSLAGRAAGVQITVPNGVLNNPPVFRIRGTNSISLSSYPLIIIDGVIAPTGDFSSTNASGNPLASVNPNDIESIDIAKDAASTAIYGSRAANGVVFITTKRGKSGKPRVGLDVWTGWTNTYRIPQVMDAFQYTEYKNMAAANNPSVNTTNPSGAGYTRFNLMTDANGNNVNTNWQDVIYRQGFQYNATFNVSGGNENTNYYFAAGYTNQEGIIRRNNFKRSNVLFNLDSRVSKIFTIGGKISYANSKNEASINSGSLPGEGFSTAGAGRLALVNAPNVPVFKNDGTYNIIPQNIVGGGANSILQVGFYNPQPILDLNRSNNENHQIQSNVYAQIKPFEWLALRTQYGIDYLLADNDIFWNPIHGDGFAAGGQTFANQRTEKRWMLTNTAQIEKSFADHNFNLLIGQEQDRRTSRGYGINRQTLSDPIYNVVQAGFNVNNPFGNVFGENYLVSGFGRLNYNFRNKYFVSGNVRQDEYSALGVKKGTFWGASVGWDITREDFWQSAGLDGTFSQLRLKGSYGKVGNISGIGDYTTFSSFSSGLYGGNPTQFFSAAGNPELRWETSKKTDVGFSFGLFRDRLTGEFAYYNNDIDDLILNVPQSPSAGLPSSIPLNVGTMYNRGFEFSLTGNPIQSKDFTWTSSFNITTNKNEVTSLAPGLPFILTATSGLESVSRTEVGHPLGTLWVVRTGGVDPATGRRIYINNQGQQVFYQHVAPAGQFQWMTTAGSHRAITQSADAVMHANVLPKTYGGFDNTFRYKGFDLNVLTTFQAGFFVYYGTNAGLHDQRFWNNHVDVLTDAWQKPGDTDKKYARPVYLDNVSNGSSMPLDINVFKGDFIKLRDIRLGYSLPKNVIDRMKINSMRLYVAGQNLAVFTAYPGPDPEVSSNGNGTTNQGVDRNTVPNARTITIGLNVGF